MVSASGSETRDSSSTPASAVIYDAYTSIIWKTSNNFCFPYPVHFYSFAVRPDFDFWRLYNKLTLDFTSGLWVLESEGLVRSAGHLVLGFQQLAYKNYHSVFARKLLFSVFERPHPKFFLLFFYFFYYRSICIIHNGASRRQTRNACFPARCADYFTTIYKCYI